MAQDRLDGDTDSDFPRDEPDSREDSSGLSLMDWARFVLNAAWRRRLVATAVFLACIGLVFAVYRFKQPAVPRRDADPHPAPASLAIPGATWSPGRLPHAFCLGADPPAREPGGRAEAGERRWRAAILSATGNSSATRPWRARARRRPDEPAREAPRSRPRRHHHGGDDHHQPRLAGSPSGVPDRRGRSAGFPRGPPAPGRQGHRRRHLVAEGTSGTAARPAGRRHRGGPSRERHCLGFLARARHLPSAACRARRRSRNSAGCERPSRPRSVPFATRRSSGAGGSSSCRPSWRNGASSTPRHIPASSVCAGRSRASPANLPRSGPFARRSSDSATSTRPSQGRRPRIRTGTDRGSGVRRARPTSNASVDQSERVRDARFQYQQMAERVSAAQTDLDNARAAFKFRYSIVWPAEVPRKPVSPNPFKYLGCGYPCLADLGGARRRGARHRERKDPRALARRARPARTRPGRVESP